MPAPLPFAPAAVTGPGFRRGTLTIEGDPADTFLALPAGFTLGCAFVNGFNVGRFWNVGPQLTPYVPALRLRRGANEIVIFDAVDCAAGAAEFRDRPVLDAPVPNC